MVMSNYTDTSGQLAREAGTTVALIQRYAELGLLKYVRASNGVRLFAPGQAGTVRRVYAQRMANRGNRKA